MLMERLVKYSLILVGLYTAMRTIIALIPAYRPAIIKEYLINLSIDLLGYTLIIEILNIHKV